MVSRMRLYFGLFFVVVLVFESFVAGRPNPKATAKIKAKPVRLDETKLPALKDLLTELGMDSRFSSLIRMGVVDSTKLLRLTSMDFRIMQMEWDGFSEEDSKSLQTRIAELIEVAKMPDELPPDPNLAERNKLKYGRLYTKNSVQSFDYAIASFGCTHPPIGPKKLFIMEKPNEFGCIDLSVNITEVHAESATELAGNYENTYIVVKRGMCSFLQKAQFVKSNYRSASGMIVINNVDQVESPSSGYGIDKSITDNAVVSFNKQPSEQFIILSVSNSSWAKLERSISANKYYNLDTMAAAVPLKCGRLASKDGTTTKTSGTGSGNCYPLIEADKELATEVTCGNIQFSVPTGAGTQQTSPSFDFLASYVGATLPDGLSHEVALSLPLNGCVSLNNGSIELEAERKRYEHKALVMERGGCPFSEKLMFAQSVGALYAIIIDNSHDNALQHIGVADSFGSVIGIPSVMITKAAGAWLLSLGSETGVEGTGETMGEIRSTLTLHKNSAGVDTIAQHWLELAHYPWVSDRQGYLMQLNVLLNKYQYLNVDSPKFQNLVDWLTIRKDRAG